jgi:hypothetical protein
MKLVNVTPYPARLLRAVVDEQRLFGAVVVRISHDIVDGRLRPSDVQRWQVEEATWNGPWGPMPADRPPRRGGVDILIFGSARAHGGRPVPRIDVAVEIGTRWRSRIIAWGDRSWRRSLGGLVPSDPEPRAEVPLTLARAFGGSDEWDGLQVPFVDNPEGRGFYLEESRAHGKPLPNLEDPRALISRWDDHPEPVGTGLCAPNFGPRARRGVELADDKRSIRGILPLFFNDAFPGMVAPAVASHDRVVVHGVRGDGPLEFTLPDNPLRVDVRIGDDGGVRPPEIDQIGVEPDTGRVFLAYRYVFRYVMTPRERRSCRLSLAPAG